MLSFLSGIDLFSGHSCLKSICHWQQLMGQTKQAVLRLSLCSKVLRPIFVFVQEAPALLCQALQKAGSTRID